MKEETLISVSENKERISIIVIIMVSQTKNFVRMDSIATTLKRDVRR